MRWEHLFDDLLGSAREDAVAGQEAELPERIRSELAGIGLTDRLLAHEGRLEVVLGGGRVVEGDLADAGDGWVVLEEALRRPVLVRTAGLVEVVGLGRAAASQTHLGRRLGLGHPLRALARNRSVVTLEDEVGRVLHGTIDAVGADLVELARHAPHLPRRREHVEGLSVVPFSALRCVTATDVG